MRDATLEVSRSVSIEGVKPIWKIHKPSDSIEVDGVVFVRVSRTMYSLNSLVAFGHGEVPDGHEQECVRLSKGLKALVSQRNMLQAEAFKEESRGCQLFDQAPKQHKQVTSHAQKADMRKTPQTMELSVEIDGSAHKLEVLRPVHPTDNLFVAYQAPMIATLLHVMRTGGFDEPILRPRHPELPKGIHKRKNFYLAKYKKPSGSNGYKKLKTVEEAVAFLAGVGERNVADDDGASEGDPANRDCEAPDALDED